MGISSIWLAQLYFPYSILFRPCQCGRTRLTRFVLSSPKRIVSNGIYFTAPIFCVIVQSNKSCSESMGFDQDASYKILGHPKNCLNIFYLIRKCVANLAIRKTRQNPATRIFKRKLREHCNTATLSYSTPSYSTKLYATHSYSPLASYSQLL